MTAYRPHKASSARKEASRTMLTKKEQSILQALEPQAQEEGIEIVTVEVVGSKKAPTIRVYIDTPDGVGFDELSAAQSWIDGVVERIDPFPGAYMLEVSSPGIDRPLRTLEHFERFAGEQAVVKLAEPLRGRSTFTGTLEGARGEAIVMRCDDEVVELPFNQVKRAHLKGTVDFK